MQRGVREISTVRVQAYAPSRICLGTSSWLEARDCYADLDVSILEFKILTENFSL